MVTIKLFGSLRLKSGCKGLEADVSTVKEACQALADSTTLQMKELKNCVVMVNGKQSKFSSKIEDGSEVVFLAPAGGG